MTEPALSACPDGVPQSFEQSKPATSAYFQYGLG